MPDKGYSATFLAYPMNGYVDKEIQTLPKESVGSRFFCQDVDLFGGEWVVDSGAVEKYLTDFSVS
jgi:hypothetical protein